MRNSIVKFRQSSAVFEKPGILSENLETFLDFFKFYLDLELFVKIKKNLVSIHSVFTLLLITQDLHKIKKFPQTFS